MGVRLKIEFDDVDDMMYVLTGKHRPDSGFAALAGLMAAIADAKANATMEGQRDSCDPKPGDDETNVVTNYASLEVGDRVRWEGRSIQADGEVISVDVNVDADGDVVIVRIKRDDNGKTFKITFDDGPTYGKMYKL